MWTKLQKEWQRQLKTASLLALLVAAVVMTLFNEFEMGGETWGYWMFARIFGETHEFVTADRSPLYTLYLNAFRWLNYPISVTAEYLTTMTIAMAAMIILLKRFIGLTVGVFAALLWLPFLQSAEPPVQTLAMAFSCFGIAARWSNHDRTKYAGSYALFAIAYLFRSSYLIFVILFFAWDLFQLLRRDGTGGLIGKMRSLPKMGWPVILPAILLAWFLMAQSASPWNNVNFSTMTWFPNGNPKSLANSQLIQAYNQQYISYEYGTLDGLDFYYTNEELFAGNGSSIGAIKENWQFMLQQSGRNLKYSLGVIADLTEVRKIYTRLDPPLPKEFWFAVIIIGIWFGAAKASREPDTLLFVIGCTAVVLVTMWFLPTSPRHYVAIIPIMVLGASWYGRKLIEVVSDEPKPSSRMYWFGLAGTAGVCSYLIIRAASTPLDELGRLIAIIMTVGFIAVAIMGKFGTNDTAHWVRRPAVTATFAALALVILTTGATSWLTVTKSSISNISNNATVLQGHSSASMKKLYNTVDPLLNECHGIMSFEHKFFGAFSEASLKNIYDIFEIPPFGSLGDSEYNGLRPDRIDCVFVSKSLATSLGGGFNVRMRYENYIVPYVQQLNRIGAINHDFGTSGKVTVLDR